MFGYPETPAFTVLYFSESYANRRPGPLPTRRSLQDYSLKDKKTDFFISTKGNDSWSGTLAEPNAAGTDGPFATVQRVQKAVRALKIATFLPKKPTLDKRYIESSHPYAAGSNDQKPSMVSFEDFEVWVEEYCNSEGVSSE